MLVGPALRRIGSTKMGLVIHTGTNTNLHLIDGNRRTFTSAPTDIFTLLSLVNHLSTALLPLLILSKQAEIPSLSSLDIGHRQQQSIGKKRTSGI